MNTEKMVASGSSCANTLLSWARGVSLLATVDWARRGAHSKVSQQNVSPGFNEMIQQSGPSCLEETSLQWEKVREGNL